MNWQAFKGSLWSDRFIMTGPQLLLVVPKNTPEETVLEGLEHEARDAKKGLWTDPQPLPPWEWRNTK